jgi:3-oxoacyl-[acyl-carrier protein] reductase
MKAIVTGGNRGIGLEITNGLLRKGYTVHVMSRTGIEHSSEDVISWSRDLNDWNAVSSALEEIGTPDVLVNNAGIMNRKTAAEYDADDITLMLNVNLVNTVRLSVMAAEGMAAAGGGRIVSIGSLAGQVGHTDIWYGITKAGLANAMRSLARSHGPRGVVANTVAPGPIQTEMIKSIPPERQARLMAATITGRFGAPEEVAEVVCWLATDAPAFINGDIIDVNNGMNCR